MAEDDMADSRTFGLQFSAIGAVVMILVYLLQVTNTADFILAPIVTLTIAIVAAVGASLFYYSMQSSM